MFTVTPTEFIQKPDDVFTRKRAILAGYINSTVGRNGGNQTALAAQSGDHDRPVPVKRVFGLVVTKSAQAWATNNRPIRPRKE